ncbi:hypothetical protein ERO13_A07G192600v2 [Gossypium hirsutum]|nr:hypothetical protein ERO13_A07G192600v2 [Gossypium hirsutum]
MQSEARGVYGVASVEECEATARGELIPGEATVQTFLGFQFLKPKFRWWCKWRGSHDNGDAAGVPVAAVAEVNRPRCGTEFKGEAKVFSFLFCF